MKNVLITGAAGFLGHQLFKRLKLFKNVNVFGIDNLSIKPVINTPKNLIKMDVQKVNSKLLLTKKIDTIFHFAAKKNVKTSFYNLSESTENYDMTLKLFNACKNTSVKKIYVASTCEIFGYQNNKLREDSTFNPYSPYAVSKVAIEYLINVYAKLIPDLKITSLNFFNTYGPTEGRDAVIPNFIFNSINKNKIIIEGNGSQARDFTYIDDTIDVLINIYKSKKFFRSINIGSGEDISVKKISSLLKKKFPNLRIIFTKKRPNEIKTFVANNRLIKKQFKFKKTVNLNEGLNKIINFYAKL